MTELSFLLDLLLQHELQPRTKEAVADRLREVERMLTTRPMSEGGIVPKPVGYPTVLTHGAQQAPSTLALMAKHGDIPAMPSVPVVQAPEPVAVVAQTPATAAAMQSRQQAISEALSGKIDKTTGRPKKF